MTLQSDATHDAEIAGLAPWFHNLHLPDGRETAPDHPLGDFPSFKWREIAPHVPDDLQGWTALDIGCNAGFYTFELARRGAHVTASPTPSSSSAARSTTSSAATSAGTSCSSWACSTTCATRCSPSTRSRRRLGGCSCCRR